MNWWKQASDELTFDNFKQRMPEIAAKVLADPVVLKSIEDTGSVGINDVQRILGCEPVIARVITPRLQDYYYSSPQAKAYSEKQKRRRDDEYLYHVTTHRNLRQIRLTGLSPNRSGRSNFDGWYTDYSQGRIFLCGRGGVPYWIGKVEEMEENKQRNNYRYRPSKTVVVRVRKADVTGQIDDIAGTNDSRNACYYVEQPIAPDRIEIVRDFAL